MSMTEAAAAATTYQDLLVRGRLGETNTLPRNASSASPDIIPYGLGLAPDPQTTFGTATAYAADQGKALIANGVIGDFRAPDVLRFGFTPLYLRYSDVWEAALVLKKIVETEAWRRPEFQKRQLVT